MNSSETKQTPTMTLPSKTAVALWVCELSGQISDGMWENASPLDHWRFWTSVDVRFGPEPALDTCGVAVRKNAYNFAGLFADVGDRMQAYAKMAKAGADPKNYLQCSAGEYMPATLAQWRQCKESQVWPGKSTSGHCEWIKDRMDLVDDDLAQKFYQTSYTLKDMRADIKLIKKTMKLAEITR